jgi:c-di-GMP-binding flagellar brake protein YcgR
MTTVRTGNETVAYDGSHIPSATSVNITNLTSGEYYKFRVTAINRAGEGEKSPITTSVISAQLPAE